MRHVVAVVLFLLAVPARADEAVPDPALVQRAVTARATGQLIDVERADELVGCRDLGGDVASSPVDGLAGRAKVRVALRKIARARGASHVHYSDHAAGPPQVERGRFYDCTGDAAPIPPPAPPASIPPPAPIAAPEVVAPPPAAPANVGLLSLQVEALPAGWLQGTANASGGDTDLTTTVGVAAAIEVFPSRGIALGFVPRVVLGLKPDNLEGAQSAYEVDLRGRARFGQLDGAGLAFSGYLTLGGSWIVFPGDTASSSGATFGFGAVASHALERRTFVLFDVGYQIGDQSISMGQTDTTFSTRLFHIGIGFGSYL